MARADRVIGIIAIVMMVALIGVFVYFMFFSKQTDVTVLFRSNAEQKIFQKIKVSYEVSDYDKALDLISDYLVDYPENNKTPRVMLIAANILLKKADYDGAKRYVVKVVSLDSATVDDIADAAVVLGAIMKETGQFDPDALNQLEDAYFKSPSTTKRDIAVFLGYAYLAKRDYQTAINYFNNSTGAYSLIGRAEVYIAQGKYAEAIQDYLNYFTQYPKTTYYTNIKADFLKHCYEYAESRQKLNYYGKAIEYYLKIINNFPDEQYADISLYKIATIYYDNKNLSSSLIFLDKVLNNTVVYSDDAAYFQKAIIYYEQNKKAQSLNEFKKLQDKFSTSTYTKKSWEWVELITKEMQY